MIELCENVLTTDYVKGGTLHYFTYATEWSDREHIKEFKTTAEALEWYEKNMRERVISQGMWWLEEDGIKGTEEDAINEWENITYGCIEE